MAAADHDGGGDGAEDCQCGADQHEFAETRYERCVDRLANGFVNCGIEVGGNFYAGEVESLSDERALAAAWQ